MAISTTWVPFNNGDAGSAVRTSLNTFNTQILADMVSTEGRVTTAEGTLATAVSDVSALDVRVTANEADIVVLQSPKDSLLFTPQSTLIAHTEGQLQYYAEEGTFIADGPAGSRIALGHTMHVHVVNNSGATIPAGTAVRVDGVALGVVQVVPALATTFNTSVVFGFTSEDILNTAKGAVITNGEVNNIDTTGLIAGMPAYLSDTVAGALTNTPPDIATQVGGAVVIDAISGQFTVKIESNINLPDTLGFLQGFTLGNDTYALTSTPQALVNYNSEGTIVTTVDALTGKITPLYDGAYRGSFTASISFPINNNTRTVTFGLYDVTTATVLYEYDKNIPKDATDDSLSFDWPFVAVANREYQITMRSDPNITITLKNVSFDVTSINAR